MQSFPNYSSLPQQQSMAPAHQSIVDPRERCYSIPRKPVSTQSWGSQKTAQVSEHEVERTSNDVLRSNEEHSKEDSFGRLWLVELLSLTLAFVAFVAIVITLMMHQDRPLPKWPSLISINTLVAIFTAIMKACMLLPIAEGVSQLKWLWFRSTRPLIDLERFDSASRGPWGCILLVFKRHISQLATLGALITVIAMAIDPFAQQVIQYDYCSTTAPEAAAYIPRTNNYTAGSRANEGGAGFLSGPMNAAFYGGLYDPPSNASSNIRIDCPTGNCTFPAADNGVSYMSLGMCSSCTDISNEITNRTTIDSDGKSIFAYILPSNLSISPLGRNSVAASLVLSQSEQGTSPMLPDSIVNFEMLTFQTAACKDIDTFTDCPIWASRCSLTPCVKSYAANISNGILEERELSSTSLQYLAAAEGYAYFGIFTNHTIVNGEIQSCTPTTSPTGRNTLRMAEGVTWVSESYLQAPSSALYYPPECAFTLGFAATDGLTGNLYATYNNQTIESIVTNYDGASWMLQLFDNGAATPQSLNTAIAGLANAITAAVRNGGDAINSVPATGSVLISQTCIRVRWAWLVLPASLLLLATLFLCGTILQTAGDSVGKAWKSSPLALLFHGFSLETGGKVGSLSEMNATARKMRARIRWEDNGWRFAEVGDETALDACSEGVVARGVDDDVSEQVYFPPPPKHSVRKQ